MMKPEVIGLTTEYANIAKILGVKSEKEYGLYQETEMGKYYARYLPGGIFEKRVVRLISREQGAKLNAAICTTIKEAGKKLQKSLDSTPVINMDRFNEKMEELQVSTEKHAQDIKNSLERIGFSSAN